MIIVSGSWMKENEVSHLMIFVAINCNQCTLFFSKSLTFTSLFADVEVSIDERKITSRHAT